MYLHMKYEKIMVNCFLHTTFILVKVLFLTIFSWRMKLEKEESEVPDEKKVTRLAIGIQGGFDADPLAKKFETRKNFSVVILPKLDIVPWPNDALPDKVSSRAAVLSQLRQFLTINFCIGSESSTRYYRCRIRS